MKITSLHARLGCFLVALFATCLLANREAVYFECPCTLTSDGEGTLELTTGFHNLSPVDLSNLEVRVRLQDYRNLWASSGVLGTIDINLTISEEALLTGEEFSADFDVTSWPNDEYFVVLELREETGTWHDTIFMKQKVDPESAFTIDFLDYLQDSDDDGVGDVNEEMESTDPNDPNSVPEDSVIDILGLYGQSFADNYDGDATTRIQHLFEVANQYAEDSNLPFTWRIVGTVLVDMDDQSTTLTNTDDVVTEGRRHGSDLNVLFGPFPDSGGYCGFAPLYGWGMRGNFSFNLDYALATVVGDCDARTLAHELGHLMGLGHSVWQNSTGAWRWSRGHAVEQAFYTIMSYGHQGGNAEFIFSDPDEDCGDDEACGVAHDHSGAADAVASLNAVRFQIASFRQGFDDTDSDGFVDPVDAFPDDATEWQDTDLDGIGNNADDDDDNDGYLDVDDVFPLDASEWADSDGDGYGDNGDEFPDDAGEWVDTDGDGYGDNGDVFPNDPTEWADTDNDGYGDNSDAFPEDSREWVDTDSDGIGNNGDDDDDGDLTLDDHDAYPLDSTLTDFFSYKFIGESEHRGQNSQVGGFVNGDVEGADSFLYIGTPSLLDGNVEKGGVYFIATQDLEWLDEHDGQVDRIIQLEHVSAATNSWKIIGAIERSKTGWGLIVGDIDPSTALDVVIAAPLSNERGAGSSSIYLLPFEQFSSFDEADGTTDRVIRLESFENFNAGWKLLGDAGDELGREDTLASGDVTGDDQDDLLIGIQQREVTDEDEEGYFPAAYLITSDVSLTSLDDLDGTTDRTITLSEGVSTTGAKLFMAERNPRGRWTSRVDLGADLNEDGFGEVLIGSPGYSTDGQASGLLHVISGQLLSDLDATDEEDGRLDLAKVADQAGSWRITAEAEWIQIGSSLRFVEDISNDGIKDIFATGTWATFLLASSDLEALDEQDGTIDGSIRIYSSMNGNHSMQMWGLNPRLNSDRSGSPLLFSSVSGYFKRGVFQVDDVELDRLYHTVSSRNVWFQSDWVDPYRLQIRGSHSNDWFGTDFFYISDFDDDDEKDLLVLSKDRSTQIEGKDIIHVISSRDINELQRRHSDYHPHTVFAGDLFGNADGDGQLNLSDRDDDNDGVNDVNDVFQFDDSEWDDSDLDGFGDNSDAFPYDWEEHLDTDEDGLGDNYADDDDDNDGILDVDDEYPLDTDNDGEDNVVDIDDDGDGTVDAEDAFPYNPDEQFDTDSDGIGDNADTDDDNDGYLDGDDAFPLDASEWVDTDGDGFGDNGDAFPEDSEEWVDTDNDGTGNNADTDDDNDGVPDDSDDFPLDSTKSSDVDGDGVADEDDAFPNDASEWSDLDQDGLGDNSDPDVDGDDIMNVDDLFPTDATRADMLSVTFRATDTLEDIGEMMGPTGDVDGDGHDDFAIVGQNDEDHYRVYLLSGKNLLLADTSDGFRDGVVNSGEIVSLENSWEIVVPDKDDHGVQLIYKVGDMHGEGLSSFVLGTSSWLYGDAYAITTLKFEEADAEDESTDGVVQLSSIINVGDSYKFPARWNSQMGTVGATIGDISGDGLADLLLGEPGTGAGNEAGIGHVARSEEIDSLSLPGSFGIIYLVSADPPQWKFSGQNGVDRAGIAVAAADFDGDGLSDVVVAADEHDANHINDGAVYVVGSRDWEAIDESDGSSDSDLALASVSGYPNSWKFTGNQSNARLGSQVLAGNLVGDSDPELILTQGSTVYVIPQSDFASIDAADGEEDGNASMANVGYGANTWTMDCGGCNLALVESTDEVAKSYLLIGRKDSQTLGFVIAGEDFSRLDEADGAINKKFDHYAVHEQPSSYEIQLIAARGQWASPNVAHAGDVDGDGKADLLVWFSGSPSRAYLVLGGEMEFIDELDGSLDGVIMLDNLTLRERSPNSPY